MSFHGADAAENLSVDQGIRRMIQEGSRFVFLGEDHNTSGLASGLNEVMESLKKNSPFNCLFLELSQDIQPQLQGALQRRDLAEFSRIVFRSREEAYVKAFERMGYTRPDHLANLRSQYVARENNPLLNFPFNQKTIDFLSENQISLIAYDADSDSPETFANTYVNLMNRYSSRTRERDLEALKNGNIRSQIMNERIKKQFAVQRCQVGLIVVGYAHLYSERYSKEILKMEADLTPLQDLLREAGFKSSVVIVEERKEIKTPIFEFAPEKPVRFNDYLGRLFVPNL